VGQPALTPFEGEGGLDESPIGVALPVSFDCDGRGDCLDCEGWASAVLIPSRDGCEVWKGAAGAVPFSFGLGWAIRAKAQG
jgi:hypothetical protein